MYKVGDRLVTGHRLIKFLGRGNFGEVWQASAPGNTFAALKFLNLEQTQGRREYRAIQPLKNLRHANLLQMTAIWLLDENGEIIPDDVAMDNMFLDTVRGTMQTVTVPPNEHRAATLIIAMPYADMSLDRLLSNYKERGEPGIPRDELFDYMEDAAKAIDFLNAPHHDLGQGPMAIRHCDVKPENLLLMGQSVVLCDFGVSRPIIGASTARKTSMGGSLAYMAPECLSDEVTEYSDQFSLAISYLELRTGNLPFEQLSQAAVMDQRRRGILDLSGLPKAEAAVIRHATAVNPSKRFASAMDMVNALRESTQAKPRFGWGKVVVGSMFVLGLVATAVWLSNLYRNDVEKNGGGGSGTSNPGADSVDLVETRWLEDESQAFSSMDTNWSAALDSLASSFTARPPTDLEWPSSQYSHRTGNKRRLLPRWPFVATGDAVVFAMVFDKGNFTLGKSLNGKFEPSALVLQSLTNQGLFGTELIAAGISAETEEAVLLSTDPEWRLPGQALVAKEDLVDIAFADSGKNAAVLNWSKSKLVSLAEPISELQLPDPEENRYSALLSDDGNWIAILVVPVDLYIGKLDGSMSSMVRLALGQEDVDDFAASDRSFSFQSHNEKGYITLTKNTDNQYLLQLVEFSLGNPKQFNITDLTQKLEQSDSEIRLNDWTANYAQLEARDERLMLSVGSKSKGALVLPNVPNLDERIAARLSDGEVDCCVTLSGSLGADNQRWMVWSTNSSLYMQPLDKTALGIKFASSNRQPVRMHLSKDQLVVGYSTGDFDSYDFKKLRLMYLAALKAGLLPKMQPSSVRPSTS